MRYNMCLKALVYIKRIKKKLNQQLVILVRKYCWCCR